MAHDAQNKPTAGADTDRFGRRNLKISGNIEEDEGLVSERVIEMKSEETSSSSTLDTKSEVNRDEPAATKVPEIVIPVDELSNDDLAREADQGTSGRCSMNCRKSNSEECGSVNCLKSNSEPDLNKNVSVKESGSIAVAIRSGSGRSVGGDSEGERVCRICHLSYEQPLDAEMREDGAGNAGASELIQLGCGCKDELGIAHVICAEAWFKLKGNRLCEICGETARNISGVWDDRFIDKWNDRLSISSNFNGQPERTGCWRGQPFCNFLMACLVIAFVLPWFFRVRMF